MGGQNGKWGARQTGQRAPCTLPGKGGLNASITSPLSASLCVRVASKDYASLSVIGFTVEAIKLVFLSCFCTDGKRGKCQLISESKCYLLPPLADRMMKISAPATKNDSIFVQKMDYECFAGTSRSGASGSHPQCIQNRAESFEDFRVV